MEETAILTEHLGFPPIVLIDDIINSVNNVMFKCTQGIEKYLTKNSTIDQIDYSTEILTGVSQLESILEQSVDKNFDKFELYTLRNIFHIPSKYIQTGTFRLEGQENVKVIDKDIRKNTIEEENDKILEIQQLIQENKQICEKIRKAKDLQKKVSNFKILIQKIIECVDTEDESIKSILKSVQPIDKTMQVLTKGLHDLYIESEEHTSVERIKDIIETKKSGNENSQEELKRANYIKIFSSEYTTTNEDVEEDDDDKKEEEGIEELPSISKPRLDLL